MAVICTSMDVGSKVHCRDCQNYKKNIDGEWACMAVPNANREVHFEKRGTRNAQAKVIETHRDRNRITGYTIEAEGKKCKVTKDQLSKLIDRKQISNATKQVWKGSVIIRVK